MYKNYAKRKLDCCIAFIVLIIGLAPMLIIAFAIKIDSHGPVLFKQDRIGKDGKVFKMLKFRSMYIGAEKKGTGVYSGTGDRRVTRVGRFMRATSIDELPQLFNIFFGSMSIVGPRPCVSYELGDYDTLNRKYKKRFNVKAGLTGLAQVKGRNDISWDDKVAYDNQYVDLFKKRGILIDIQILFESVIKVFKKENIYENKSDENMSDIEAAKLEEKEIIRIAHLPDEGEL